MSGADRALRHTPPGDGIYLDHLAHWIPDLAAGAEVLERMGFVLTPRTEHTHSPAPGAPVEPAGTANHCIMLRAGYLEILTATADTEVAREVRARLAHHVGVHLAAFCVNDAAAERERLLAAGFPQRPLVALEREARMADGRSETLRFTVVRPEAGSLPEGRVQFLTQHTPELVWEPRWLRHRNGVLGLTGVVFCAGDVEACAQRYARYLRAAPAPVAGGQVLALERGAVAILDRSACREAFAGAAVPEAPCMAGYALEVEDLPSSRAFLDGAGFECRDAPGGALAVPLPDALGSVMVLHEGGSPPWRTGGR